MMTEQNKSGKELSDYGIIYLSGEISDELSDQVNREIIEMNVSGKVDHIQMIINSPGGSVFAGLAIIDMMEWSRIPIYTTGLGMIASAALMIFMVGEHGRRVVTPRTSILSHRFSALHMGNHSQLLASRKQDDLLHDRIVEHYLTYTSVESVEKLEQTLLKDVDAWLTLAEAKDLGIVDIIEPLRPLHKAHAK